MGAQAQIAVQHYVPNPKIGELLAMASDRGQIPVILASFSKLGGWQVYPVSHYGTIRKVKKGISQTHDMRLVRMEITNLTAEQYGYYQEIIKKLNK